MATTVIPVIPATAGSDEEDDRNLSDDGDHDRNLCGGVVEPELQMAAASTSSMHSVPQGSASDSIMADSLVLMSGDGLVKYSLPVSVVGEYLPLVITAIKNEAPGGRVLVLLDGVQEDLLTLIVEWLEVGAENQDDDEEAEILKRIWRFGFVKNLDTEMLARLQSEVEKRGSLKVLERFVKKELAKRSSHWKASMLEKYLEH